MKNLFPYYTCCIDKTSCYRELLRWRWWCYLMLYCVVANENKVACTRSISSLIDKVWFANPKQPNVLFVLRLNKLDIVKSGHKITRWQHAAAFQFRTSLVLLLQNFSPQSSVCGCSWGPNYQLAEARICWCEFSALRITRNAHSLKHPQQYGILSWVRFTPTGNG